MLSVEVLKQPLHTSIAIDTTEFSHFNVEEMLHIIISVKDFKTIVTHASILDTEVSAAYSYPSKPMQLKYSDEGVRIEFILMTIGDYRASSATPVPNATRLNSTRTISRKQLEASSSGKMIQSTTSMPPPARPAAPSVARQESRPRILRPSPPPPQPTLDSDSLFLQDDDEDRRWDPSGYGDDDEELLGWDASADTVRIHLWYAMYRYTD